MNKLRIPLFFSFFNEKNLHFSVKNEGFLTAQFLDFFACFLREEFFVIKFRRTSSSDEEMQPLVSTLLFFFFFFIPEAM